MKFENVCLIRDTIVKSSCLKLKNEKTWKQASYEIFKSLCLDFYIYNHPCCAHFVGRRQSGCVECLFLSLRLPGQAPYEARSACAKRLWRDGGLAQAHRPKFHKNKLSCTIQVHPSCTFVVYLCWMANFGGVLTLYKHTFPAQMMIETTGSVC